MGLGDVVRREIRADVEEKEKLKKAEQKQLEDAANLKPAEVVKEAFKSLATKQGLNKSKGKELAKAVLYFENNRQHMRYDEYLAQGYPIGSGVVEGACRHLVKDRMELTGMRWRVPGAQAILKLRAVMLNGDWEQFQEDHAEENCRNLYPYREFVMLNFKKAG